MTILVDKRTRLVVQGITGKAGSFHAILCKNYGTNVVAGVTPGKGGGHIKDIPVYNTVQETVDNEAVNTAIIFVPAPFAADAIMEAAWAGLDLVVCITEGIPIQDMLKVKRFLRDKNTTLVGPNSPGIVSPGSKTKVGIMPDNIYKAGAVGVISRSGTLSYEVINLLTKCGLGQSTFIGIGGDPVIGLNFVDCLELFENDPQTQAVVMVGEIGGSAEEEAAAEIIAKHITKPVAAYICGLTAPPEKKMGHAGAIISGRRGTASAKIAALKKTGVRIAETLSDIDKKVEEALKNSSLTMSD